MTMDLAQQDQRYIYVILKIVIILKLKVKVSTTFQSNLQRHDKYF